MHHRLAGRRAAAAVLVACASGCAGRDRDPPLQALHYAVAARSALREGDVDLADQILAEARNRFPDHGSVRLWSAELASMRWEDEQARRDLLVARTTADRGGLTQAELEGKLGDLLFRMGRYGESAPRLAAGQVGPTGAARQAWATIARLLPYERDAVDPEAAELPLVEGPLPLLVCSVGGEEHPFVLDTRATFTTLANSLAAELPVSPILPAGNAVDGSGREIASSFGILKTFSLGGIEVGPLPVLVVEDGALALRDHFGGADRSSEALFGVDVLCRFRVTFDPRRQSVVFQRRRGLDPRESQPCLWVEENLLVRVDIEGRKLWFVVDTGASASSLSELGLRELPGGERRALQRFGRVYSPGGVTLSARMVEGLVLELSEARFSGVDLQVVEREPPELFPVHGVLGADLLMRCRTTLDSGRIRVESL